MVRSTTQRFEDHKSVDLFGAFDDFDSRWAGVRERLVEFRPLIAAVGEELIKKGNIPNRVASSRTPPSRSWISAG